MKNNIFNYLFFCIIINLIPTALYGAVGIGKSTYVLLNAIAFTMQTIIMLYFFRNVIKYIPNRRICLLMMFVCLQILTQISNIFIWNSINYSDIFSIISVTINLFIFIICCWNMSVTEEQLLGFMKKITILAFIACVYNIISNASGIASILTILSSYSVSFSSFFPNRNQFGIFLLIAIISNLYIINKEKKKRNSLLQMFFIVNLALTMSRTSMIGVMVVYFIKTILDYRIYKETLRTFLGKMIIIIIVIISVMVTLNNERLMNTIDRLYIRSDTLESGSGRIDVWKNGLNILVDNNILIGVGRFNAIELNHQIYNSELNYFHSMYIETIVTYGCVGFIAFVCLIYKIVARIRYGEMNWKYKNILYSGIISFLAISSLETTTRFSIGYSDTISMLYFFVIPILCGNIRKNNELK